jgi:hypothetical protein
VDAGDDLELVLALRELAQVEAALIKGSSTSSGDT